MTQMLLATAHYSIFIYISNGFSSIGIHNPSPNRAILFVKNTLNLRLDMTSPDNIPAVDTTAGSPGDIPLVLVGPFILNNNIFTGRESLHNPLDTI